jgi:hypothetical protein
MKSNPELSSVSLGNWMLKYRLIPHFDVVLRGPARATSKSNLHVMGDVPGGALVKS